MSGLIATYSYPKKRMGVKKLKQNQKGFTLIELLVVIAIIGLLASVVLLALNSARSKSRDAKRVADVRQMTSALELFYNDNNGYPATLSSLVSSYIGAVPAAPLPVDGGCANNSSASNTYTYAGVGTLAGNVYPDYTYKFCLGASTGSLASGAHTASPAGIQ